MRIFYIELTETDMLPIPLTYLIFQVDKKAYIPSLLIYYKLVTYVNSLTRDVSFTTETNHSIEIGFTSVARGESRLN